MDLSMVINYNLLYILIRQEPVFYDYGYYFLACRQSFIVHTYNMRVQCFNTSLQFLITIVFGKQTSSHSSDSYYFTNCLRCSGLFS